MKGQHLIGLVFASIAMAAASVAYAAVTFHDDVVRSWRSTCSWIADRLDWALSKIKVEDVKNPSAPRRALIGAAQFLGRMVRRDRPLMSTRWRMCPSV